MQVASRWRTAGLVTGALLIGSVLGPPLARAAAAGLVRIESGHGSDLAAVSRSGRLAVNAGLTTTAAGQLTVTAADFRSLVVASARGLNCAAGGFYKIPAGKALIITGVDFLTSAASSGGHSLFLAAGPAATPCHTIVAAAEETETFVSQNQVFTPGIPVPAGDAVGLTNIRDTGSAELYGYLVPAAAVPASALANVRAAVPGGLAAVTPPR